MYLVKVISQDRKNKVFVKAGLLESEGCRKLKLADLANTTFQVYQEDDGTLIDDDAVFEAICEEAKTNQQKLGVMILPSGVNWSTVNSNGGWTSSSTDSEFSASSESSELACLDSSPSRLNSNERVTGGFPISTITQFLDPLVEILEKSTNQLLRLSSDDNVLEAAKGANGYPLIVEQRTSTTEFFAGDSLCDPNAEEFVVVLVVKIAVRVTDAIEAVLVLLLSYYNFNFCYHPKLQSTLEVFQRFFLEVNPPPENGNKRAKQKRIVGHTDAKVKSLAQKLADYSSLWSLESH
ncbi:PDZ and LIM domain protein 3 [Frankliniella fusca]|uniref:PDZ and LIM domain protein 3 n=1 Tax=Frankliniella fusca TaxID=407009 RepID=A0AAE1L8E6_9NEOP|nr:PDZ and LIM domain protein 3 [Frankliniella fusca]